MYLDRIAAYGLPVLSVGVAAVVLFGPGALRPSVGARVWGRPGPSELLAVRVEGVRRYFDIDDAASLDELDVTLARASAPDEVLAAWHGAAQGVVTEVALRAPRPLDEAVVLTVRGCRGDDGCDASTGPLLAVGSFAPQARGPVTRHRTLLAGARSGALELSIEIPRGTLAPPFLEQAIVRVKDAEGRPVPEAIVELSGAGFDVVPPSDAPGARATTDAKGEVALSLRALAHVVDYQATARTPDGRSGKLSGPLPVHAGAIWLEPGRGREAAVVSPAARDEVFVSADDERGRVFGAIVPLRTGPDLLARGSVVLPPDLPPSAKLTLSADALERGPATVAWPLGGETGSLDARPMELLVDGVPQAAQLEKERAWRTRRAALWLLALTAVFEALYLTHRARSLSGGRRRRPADGEDATEEELVIEGEHARGRGWLLAASLIAVVLLGFAMVGALVTFWR